MNKSYYVYIVGNQHPTLYIGVTNDLVRRIHEHKEGSVRGFTRKYHLRNLLYFECFDDPTDAITREKQLKHWNREWKLELIKNTNPTLKDLYFDISR